MSDLDSSDYDASLRNGTLSFEKPTLKFNFINQWETYDFFRLEMYREILEERFNVKIDRESYEMIMDGVVGNETILNTDSIKLYFCAEAQPAKLAGYDLSIGCDYFEADNYIRVPSYYFHPFSHKLDTNYDRGECNPNKKNFACFLVSNDAETDGCKARNSLFENLSKYKDVASGGKYRNNIGGFLKFGKDTDEWLNNCKFLISYENTALHPGYMTEKVFQAYFGGTVPIYNGNALAVQDINKDAIIYSGDFDNEAALIEYIKKVDNDDELYCKIWNQNIITDKSKTYESVKEALSEKLLGIVDDKLDAIKEARKERAPKIAHFLSNLQTVFANSTNLKALIISKTLKDLNGNYDSYVGSNTDEGANKLYEYNFNNTFSDQTIDMLYKAIVKKLFLRTKQGSFYTEPEDLEDVSGELLLKSSYAKDKIKLISDLTTSQSTVLIINAGIGAMAIPVAKHVGNVVAVEYDIKKYRLLGENIAINNITNIGTATKLNGYGGHIVFRYKTEQVLDYNYDLIFMNGEYSALNIIQNILSHANYFIIKFVPQSLQDKNGSLVKLFLELAGTYFNYLYIPSKEESFSKDYFLKPLGEMYFDNRAEYVVFSKTKIPFAVENELKESLMTANNCPFFKQGNIKAYYSQFFEDYILSMIFKDANKGFYIDVGANDPEFNSVTRYFYKKGWGGINIEPNVDLYQKIQKHRPKDINLNVGVADKIDELIFYKVSFDVASSFDKSVAESATKYGHTFTEHLVPVTTLNKIIEEHNVTTIDIMKIDVEGYEEQTLSNLDLKKHRPAVILLEATTPGTYVPSHYLWEPMLLANNYNFVLFDGINRYYLASERSDLFDGFKKAYSCILLANERYHVIPSFFILGNISNSVRAEDAFLAAVQTKLAASGNEKAGLVNFVIERNKQQYNLYNNFTKEQLIDFIDIIYGSNTTTEQIDKLYDLFIAKNEQSN